MHNSSTTANCKRNVHRPREKCTRMAVRATTEVPDCGPCTPWGGGQPAATDLLSLWYSRLVNTLTVCDQKQPEIL